jgi:hypothetical protein
MAQYYYTDGKERFGPFSIEELKEKNITPQTYVWKEGLPDWVPAGNLRDLSGLFPEEVPFVQSSTSSPSGTSSTPPKNWLIESVLVTIFCCLPLGIVGIILSTMVDTMWKEGHKEAAERLSAEAGRWVKLGIIAGVLMLIIYMLLMYFGIIESPATGIEV